MKNIYVAVLLICLTLILGCKTLETKEGQGAVLGSLAGGLLGSQVGDGSGQVIATAAGAIAGGYFGSSIGRGLDERDQLQMERAAGVALERTQSNTTTKWANPDSGNSGTITPTRTFQKATGQYCREYTTAINVGGDVQNAHGTACRQADGSWRIVS